jgi:hypothetical protein
MARSQTPKDVMVEDIMGAHRVNVGPRSKIDDMAALNRLLDENHLPHDTELLVTDEGTWFVDKLPGGMTSHVRIA